MFSPRSEIIAEIKNYLCYIRAIALCAWYSDLIDGDLFQWEQLFLADHEICCVMMAVSALGYDVMLLCGLLFECLGCQRD